MPASSDPALSDAEIDALLVEDDGYQRAARLMFERGWRKADIARRLDVHRITVHRWLDTAYRERERAQQREYKRTTRVRR